MKGKLTEVLVASRTTLDYRWSASSTAASDRPGMLVRAQRTVPGLPQPTHVDAREILIREKLHACLLSFGGGESDNTLRLQDLGGVAESRTHVIVCQAGVVLDDRLLGPTCGHEFDDLFNSQVPFGSYRAGPEHACE